MLFRPLDCQLLTVLALALLGGISTEAAAAQVINRDVASPVTTVTQEQLEQLPTGQRIEDLLKTCPVRTIPTVSRQSATLFDGRRTSPTSSIDCVQPADIRMIDVYKAHNALRSEYGATPLRWNTVLAENAQIYANRLAQTGQRVHASRDGRGTERENISQGMIGWNANQLMRNWLDERRYFAPGTFPNVSTTGNWYRIGHYSQMIWPTTTDIGCGMATGSGFSWLVCRYDPGGNKDGKLVGVPPIAIAQAPVININNAAPASPRPPQGVPISTAPNAKTETKNFSTKRRVAFCGHMWIIIDDYDAQGKKIGELSLHFSPDGFTVNPTNQDLYPKGFGFAVESTRAADLRLLEMWRYQAANKGDFPVDLPLIGPWSPANNCITQSMMWAWYGIEANEPVRKPTEWPIDCEITPEPDWAEKKRRLGLAWDNADTVSGHVDVLQMTVKQAFWSAMDACFGSEDD